MQIRAVILSTQSGDWEALYIDGKLIDEGHHLGEGNSSFYLLEKAEEYDLTRYNFCESEINDEDEKLIDEIGGHFPVNLYDLNGEYEIKIQY